VERVAEVGAKTSHLSWSRKRVIKTLLPVLVPLGATAAALLLGALMLRALGADPIVAYRALFEGAFGDRNAFANTLVRATPLLFVGTGICIAYRSGVINIGGEGQFILGALATTVLALNMPNMPGWVIIPAASAAGFLGGAFWGFIPGYLKAKFNVNEILSTVMMNGIAVQFMNYLLIGPLIDPIQIERGTRLPESARLPVASDLPRLVPTRLHLGAALAVVLAIAVWVLLWRTSIGYRIRAVGLNPHASRYAGISTSRYAMLSLTLSGAFAGLGGAIQILGLHHRMFTDGSAAGFTGSAGFNGIVAALFGGLHPIATIPASVLFGGLLVGANQLQRTVQVPSALVVGLNGLVVIFVVASQFWIRLSNSRIEAEEVADKLAAAEASKDDPDSSGADIAQATTRVIPR
jgi:general nucleoside transport system permease protein